MSTKAKAKTNKTASPTYPVLALKRPDAAKAIGVSPATLDRLVERGLIRPSRAGRGECLKDLIWKPEQRMEGKNADALMLRPFWRMVMAGNDDDAGLQICPALSPSIQDKLVILLAKQAEGLPTTHEENDEWAMRIRAELPAFAAFLLSYKPAPGLELDKRSRVVNFWHPTIVSALREMQPEIRLLELISTFRLVSTTAPHWEGTATEFESAMRDRDNDGITARLFATQQSAGRMLSELARVVPARITRTNRGNSSFYRITAE